MTSQEKLARIREKMTEKGLSALILFHTDPHQSEYLADRWNTMPWLTGFTGSAGTVLITRDQAGVWTDSRYFIQAEEELKDSGFELLKLKVSHTSEYISWLLDHCPENGRVGVEASIISMARKDKLEEKLKRKQLRLVDASSMIEEIWTERPGRPEEKIFAHEVAYTGKSREEKIKIIRQHMDEDFAQFYLMTALDEIAWTFNLRGKDVFYNPVFYAYAIIEKERALLFVDQKKIEEDLREELRSQGIALRSYNKIFDHLSDLPPKASLALDSSKLSWKMQQSLPSGLTLVNINSYAGRLKGVKNEREIERIRKVMIRDGIALVKFFRWIKEVAADEGVTEYEAGLKLDEFRAEQPHYVSPSFHPIVGYKANGAIVHYRAEEDSSSMIFDDGMLLVDSGGQYLDGTTDITRTISFDPPSPEKKRDFTLVLKGNIQLSRAIFPEGTKGFQIESLARIPLWNQLMNYGHGTGHGVGFFLNVHEGPQSLGSSASGGAAVALKPGMLTSNEPGIYHEGKYGIRIENLILCVEKGESENYGTFLGFEDLTLFPIERQLIDKEMLNKEEIDWLDAYHNLVFEQLSPHLDEAEKDWLKEACQAL